MTDRSVSPRSVTALSAAGIVGVVWYVGSWALAGVLIDGFDPLRQSISATFAVGTPAVSLRLMQAALVGSGILLVAFAVALERGLPGSGRAAPVSLAISGVLTAVLVAVPCSPGCPGAGVSTADLAHGAVAAPAYLTLLATPWLAAWRVRGHAPRFAAVSVLLGTLATLGFVLRYGGVIDQLGGLQQRIFNTIADVWAVYAGVWLIRRSSRG